VVGVVGFEGLVVVVDGALELVVVVVAAVGLKVVVVDLEVVVGADVVSAK